MHSTDDDDDDDVLPVVVAVRGIAPRHLTFFYIGIITHIGDGVVVNHRHEITGMGERVPAESNTIPG